MVARSRVGDDLSGALAAALMVAGVKLTVVLMALVLFGLGA